MYLLEDQLNRREKKGGRRLGGKSVDRENRYVAAKPCHKFGV